jgi:hypothetical protein
MAITNLTCTPCCCRRVHYGAILLTLIYVGFCYAIHALTPECLGDDECNSEGMDNSTAGFATAFFAAACMLLLAFHLYKSPRPVRKSGMTALIFLGVAYILNGVGHLFFANNGVGDGKGMLGFYIVWAFYYFCLTQSMLEHDSFVRAVKYTPTTTSQSSRFNCGVVCLKLCQSLLMLAFLVVMAGCIWCAVDKDARTSDQVDMYEEEYNKALEEPMCVQLIVYGEVAWWGCYSFFWVASSVILRAAALQDPQIVWGLPTYKAAVFIGVLQLTIGAMWIVWILVASIVLDEETQRLYDESYGQTVHHYGMLLTAYFAHNFAYTMTVPTAATAAAAAGPASGKSAKQQQAEELTMASGQTKAESLRRMHQSSEDVEQEFEKAEQEIEKVEQGSVLQSDASVYTDGQEENDHTSF